MMSRKHIRELLMVFSRVLMICVLGVNKERLLFKKRYRYGLSREVEMPHCAGFLLALDLSFCCHL
jgi:hypothetical protein